MRFSDPLPSKRARLRILVALATGSNIQALLKELLVRVSGPHLADSLWRELIVIARSQIYVKDVEDDFSADAIAAIGTCAQRVPAVAEECLQTLIKLTQSKNGAHQLDPAVEAC